MYGNKLYKMFMLKWELQYFEFVDYFLRIRTTEDIFNFFFRQRLCYYCCPTSMLRMYIGKCSLAEAFKRSDKVKKR